MHSYDVKQSLKDAHFYLKQYVYKIDECNLAIDFANVWCANLPYDNKGWSVSILCGVDVCGPETLLRDDNNQVLYFTDEKEMMDYVDNFMTQKKEPVKMSEWKYLAEKDILGLS